LTVPDLADLEGLVRGTGKRLLRATPMPGGASTRRYYRLELSEAGRAVAMFVPDGDKPEEIEHWAPARRWPFLEVRDLLEARGVRVPQLYGEDTLHGWLLIEDLGDETLASVLARAPAEKAELYVRAVRDLARAQASLAELPEASIVRSRAFDEDLLRRELDHFREWGLEARGVVIAARDRAELDGIADRLARRIASWPRGFVHRDYQSRNLMWKDGELVWIDFQDALLGPCVYDLVALLNDSYQELDRSFVEARLSDYAAAAGLVPAEHERLVREFDVVTVQRKLKDAGRFVFIDRVKHNPSFLPFVEPTLRKVALALPRLEDDADMRALGRLLRRLLPSAGFAPG
jgi:aminoglycoside/choline kinase family phosphotransferase